MYGRRGGRWKFLDDAKRELGEKIDILLLVGNPGHGNRRKMKSRANLHQGTLSKLGIALEMPHSIMTALQWRRCS
jgi:hypothetical protein